MTTQALRATASLLLTMMLVLAATASPALGAKADKKKDKKDPDPAPSAVIEVLKGNKFRMANTSMAKQVVRIEDGSGDQLDTAGQPAVGAPAHSDMAMVHVASVKVPSKLLSKMAKDFPAGTAGSFYGSDADWDPADPAIFVAATLAEKRPGDALGQQLEVGIDGDGATPVQVASAGDPLAGVERFSLSGIFNNGSWTSGTTDVSGRPPGGDIEWYNAASGNFGFYDARRSTFYVILPRARDAQSVSVTLRTSTDAGEVIDRLELPDGGTFVDLASPSGGFRAKAALEPLSCRALETFSGSSTDPAPVDPEATLIRYTAGMRSDEADLAAEVLAPAIAAAGPVSLLLTEVGFQQEETEAAEPLEVEGELAVVPGGTAITLTMEVPAGRWSFSSPEDAPLDLPNGQPLFDHASLTGSAGVLTGPGLDGVVAGDPACSPRPGDPPSVAASGSPEPSAQAASPEPEA